MRCVLYVGKILAMAAGLIVAAVLLGCAGGSKPIQNPYVLFAWHPPVNATPTEPVSYVIKDDAGKIVTTVGSSTLSYRLTLLPSPGLHSYSITPIVQNLPAPTPVSTTVTIP